MTRYAVSLGSNLGNRVANLRSAISDIATFTSGLRASRLYESGPVGGPEQGPFLNAAISFQCDLSPLQLLHRLQEIETGHGRERSQHWGPRTLDLDIIASDAGPVDGGPELVLPHPLARERLFVVKPMLDIWGDVEIAPGVTAVDAYSRVGGQDVDLVATSWVKGFGSAGKWLVITQLLLFVLIGIFLIVGGSLPATWGWFQVLGALVTVGGGLLVWWSVSALGRNLVPMPEPILDGALVEDGPFRFVRHPIYTAIIMLFAGVSMLFASWLAAVGTTLLYLLFERKSGYEEGLLRIAYPDYRDYMSRVRFRIPFLR